MGEWETAALREMEKSLHLEERSDGIATEFWWWRLEYVLGCFVKQNRALGDPTWAGGLDMMASILNHSVTLWIHRLTFFCPIYTISHSLSFLFCVSEEKITSCLMSSAETCLTHILCWDRPINLVSLSIWPSLGGVGDGRWSTGDWNIFSIWLPGVKHLISFYLPLNWQFSHWHTGW